MAYETHPWKVIESGFDAANMRLSESLTSIGNGYMGMRGNFEEDYSGDTHLGSYIGGVWFPDKTRVGWWKNGYPQYFGKAINSVRLNGIHVEINGQQLDLAKADVLEFRRELDMETGVFALFLGNRVQNRLTVLVPEAGKTIMDYGLSVDGTGRLLWPDGTWIYSSVNYVYQKDAHFHQAVANEMGLLPNRTANTARW